MADHRGRYDSNGGAAADSPPPVNGFSDGKRNSHDNEKESSKRRDRERVEGDGEPGRRSSTKREGATSQIRYYRDHRETSERREHDHNEFRDHHHSRERDERYRHHRHREGSGRYYHSGNGSHERDHYHSRPYCDRSEDLDGVRHPRHISHSHRSRSRSRSRSQSKRESGFDMPPSGSAVAPLATGTGQTSGNTLAPVIFQNPVQHMTQQATRHARRVYVGGLSLAANEQSIATFFSHAVFAIGGNSYHVGDAVINVYINHEKKFAFVEMRTVEEASNAMALDGIIFEGAPVKVRRPSDYNVALAATLGPCEPRQNLNLAAVGLTPGSASLLEGPDRIFVGGIPHYITEEQIRPVLETCGPLRAFNLVKDRETGNSKGYGFCVYQDVAVTDLACASLNGTKMGERTLTVRRASQGTGQLSQGQENALMDARQHVAALQMQLLEQFATKVVCLTQVVGIDNLIDDGDYEEIMEDMKNEGRKFGTLVKVVIPRPSPTGEPIPGVGKVFLEYADTEGSSTAKLRLNGRKFDEKIAVARFYPEDKYASGEYGN